MYKALCVPIVCLCLVSCAASNQPTIELDGPEVNPEFVDDTQAKLKQESIETRQYDQTEYQKVTVTVTVEGDRDKSLSSLRAQARDEALVTAVKLVNPDLQTADRVKRSNNAEDEEFILINQQAFIDIVKISKLVNQMCRPIFMTNQNVKMECKTVVEVPLVE